MTNPRDVVTACDRVMEMLQVEFPQLSPPDVHFILCVVAQEFLTKFNEMSGSVKRQP